MAIKYLRFQNGVVDYACWTNPQYINDTDDSTYGYINTNVFDASSNGGYRLYNLETVGIEWNKIQKIEIVHKIKHYDYTYPKVDLLADDDALISICYGDANINVQNVAYYIANGLAGSFAPTADWVYISPFWYYCPVYSHGNPSTEHYLTLDVTSSYASLSALQSAQFDIAGRRGSGKSPTINSYHYTYDFKLKITYKDDANPLFRGVL